MSVRRPPPADGSTMPPAILRRIHPPKPSSSWLRLPPVGPSAPANAPCSPRSHGAPVTRIQGNTKLPSPMVSAKTCANTADAHVKSRMTSPPRRARVRARSIVWRTPTLDRQSSGSKQLQLPVDSTSLHATIIFTSHTFKPYPTHPPRLALYGTVLTTSLTTPLRGDCAPQTTL